MEVNLKKLIFVTIFGTDSRAGKTFDVILFWMIILSVTVVVLESVSTLQEAHKHFFITTEWFFTIVFT
ncbi:MAG: ion transporter, partial [Bacteroidetes bacterium]|nr:ion transporter [Bacteroidota bacterium]